MSMPFDITRFHSLLRTRALGRNLIFEPTVASTMDVARDAAAHAAVDGTLVATDEQTAGRGRLGRTWITPPAANLASTLVLRPPHAVLRDVAMITPLAIAHAIDDVTDIRAGIKWPNDVQIGGKKVAGVLIETDLTDRNQAMVFVGAGVNVNFDPRQYDEIRDIATSLAIEAGDNVDREALLASYLAHFESLYDEAKAGGDIVGRWRERLVTLGQQVRATWQGGSAEGLAENVDGDGALLVRTADGALVRVEAGDVTLRG